MWEDAGSQTCGWRRKRKLVKERCGRGGEGGGGGKRKLFQQRNKPPAYSINCLSSNQDLSHLSTFVPEKGCLGLSLSRGWETGWWWYFKQVECVCARWDTERRYRYSHKKKGNRLVLITIIIALCQSVRLTQKEQSENTSQTLEMISCNLMISIFEEWVCVCVLRWCARCQMYKANA